MSKVLLGLGARLFIEAKNGSFAKRVKDVWSDTLTRLKMH